MSKFTLCVDFDGVVHAYNSPWIDAVTISDGPVEQAFDWLEQMVTDYTVAIYSSRSKTPGGINAMLEWFTRHGLPPHVLTQLVFPTEKPAAVLYIDDRAWLFDGPSGDWGFPTKHDIESFKPWNRG